MSNMVREPPESSLAYRRRVEEVVED